MDPNMSWLGMDVSMEKLYAAQFDFLKGMVVKCGVEFQGIHEHLARHDEDRVLIEELQVRVRSAMSQDRGAPDFLSLASQPPLWGVGLPQACGLACVTGMSVAGKGRSSGEGTGGTGGKGGGSDGARGRNT
jgi:hypothetical protein